MGRLRTGAAGLAVFAGAARLGFGRRPAPAHVGHMAMLERPGRFTELVRTFAERVPAP